jgi:hypothetical protein
MNWAGHVASMVEIRNAHIFIKNSERKSALGRHRRRWEINVKRMLMTYVKDVKSGFIWLWIWTRNWHL